MGQPNSMGWPSIHQDKHQVDSKASAIVSTEAVGQGEDVEWEHKQVQMTITKPGAKARRNEINLKAY